jgi:hypothetical protein
MSKLLYISLFSVFVFFTACEEDKYEKEYNWSYPLSGDWTINVQYDGNTDGPFFMKTYNTSFGQDSIWIDDNGNFWPLKAKAKANVKNSSFDATNSLSYPGTRYEDEVTIQNAKVINKDSIFFEVKFASDPDVLYQFSGHRRVSYDEYMSH